MVVVARLESDLDSVRAIGQGRSAVDLRTDAVALHDVVVLADAAAAGSQHDPESRVAGNQVAREDARRSRCAGRAADLRAVAAVEGPDAAELVRNRDEARGVRPDEIALDDDGGPGVRAHTDKIGGDDVRRDEVSISVEDHDTVVAVAESGEARHVGPDEVALDGGGVLRLREVDPRARVTGDEVAGVVAGARGRQRQGSADRVAARPVLNARAVGYRREAGDVGTDAVSEDRVVRRVQDDARAVTGDQVSVLRRRSSDGVAVRRSEEIDAVAVGESGRARGIGADVVPDDRVPADREADDPGAVEPVDDQGAHGAAAGRDVETVHEAAGVRAVELDQRRRRRTRAASTRRSRPDR